MNDLHTLRLQVMLSHSELSAVDDFGFKYQLPTRAPAFRELLNRGLAATMPPDAGWASSSGQGAIRAEHGSLREERLVRPRL
jgi:hypothetical protein